ncbi:MAG: hypothetical protein LC104_21985 [Bacteroidales bacterium]|nr:hypothetical protein [Bacteroidales bacterium]
MLAASLRFSMPAFVIACHLVLIQGSYSHAQPPKPSDGPPRAAALKLPDGTIVLLTRSLDEVNPPVEGVLLSGKEYQAITEQLESARKQNENIKPVAPSHCHIQSKVTTVGKQSVAALTLTYTFQTHQPRTAVLLGCARGFPRAARLRDGELPMLRADKDGLSVLVAKAGEYTLTLDVDAPIGTRGSTGEVGFELGLPRAPITTFQMSPPNPTIRDVTVGSRTPDRPTDIKRSLYSVDRLATSSGVALGPTDLLDVLWEAQSTPAPTTDTILTAETDVTVRIDEIQIETTAKLRLRGVTREWKLALPPGAEVSVERSELPTGSDIVAELGFSAPVPTLTPPTEPAKSAWTLKPPEGTSQIEWTVNVTVRQSRPKATESKFRGPYPIGPLSVHSARQTGTIRVLAPTSVRTAFKHGPHVRRQDLPADANAETIALFRFTAPSIKPSKSTPPPLLEIDATQAVGFVRIEPQIQLHLAALDPKPTSPYWRLDAKLQVTPIRSEVGQLIVELPPSWDKLEAGPLDVVDGVIVSDINGQKRYTIRLFAAQRTPFTLTLSANHSVDPKSNQASLTLMNFPQAVEQNAKLTVTVPEGLTLRGSAMGRSRDRVDGVLELLPPSGTTAQAAIPQLNAIMEKGVRRVDLAWSPYRPELPVKVDAEITLWERQIRVEQTFQFGPIGTPGEPIRFRSLKTLPPFLKFNPPLTRDPIDGDLIFRPPVGATEFTLKCSYWTTLAESPPHEGDIRSSLQLLWPEGATRVETRVRVWGQPGSPRISGFEGPWGELPPTPDPERNELPWLTLAGTGTDLPLVFRLDTNRMSQLPTVWVERAFIQARVGVGDDVLRIRARFRLARWPSHGIQVQIPEQVTPAINFAGVQISNATTVAGDALADGTSRILDVPLPPMGAESQTLEIEYYMPTIWAKNGAVRLMPPFLANATYRTPIRWHIQFAHDMMPLYFGTNLQTSRRWTWRGMIFTPAATDSTTEIEEWFQTGKDTLNPATPTRQDDTSAISAQQAQLATFALYQIPWAIWVATCTLLALVVGILFLRLSPTMVGPMIAALGIISCGIMLYWPQPFMRLVAGIQPGIWVLVLIIFGQSLIRWYYQRRVEYLPGFTRTRIDNGTLGSHASSDGILHQVHPSRNAGTDAIIPANDSASGAPPIPSKG